MAAKSSERKPLAAAATAAAGGDWGVVAEELGQLADVEPLPKIELSLYMAGED